jgi:hypothetical protein
MNRKMRSRILTRLLFNSMLLLIGVILGIIVQKYLGLGNILRAVGIPYPTAGPQVAANVLPREIPKKHQGQMRLFILAGQSNMVGMAPIPEGEKTDPHIYVFGKDYRWRIADHPIEDAFNQVDMVSQNGDAAFGSAMEFAFASLERHPEIVIGLIPCAKSSSGIVQWQRNLGDQSLYGSCLKRARAASPMGTISGILFFQGETDAADPIQYPEPPPHPWEWSDLFTAFITDLRNDLHQPELPVVFAQIGTNWSPQAYPNWDVVMNQQATLELDMSAKIITEDLPLLDGIHFTADSYRIIGKRFADAYWDLVELKPFR